MAVIMSGKEVSSYIRNKIKDKCISLKEKGITPGLAVILVGNDPASEIYVRNKKKACEEVGIYSEEYRLESDTTQEALKKKEIIKINLIVIFLKIIIRKMKTEVLN